MNMMIVKQYLRNALRVVLVSVIVALSMLIGDKFQPFTYLELTMGYLNQTEVKKTVVHKASPAKIADKVAPKKTGTGRDTRERCALGTRREDQGRIRGERRRHTVEHCAKA